MFRGKIWKNFFAFAQRVCAWIAACWNNEAEGRDDTETHFVEAS
jgi:hypothetical protein